MTTCTVSEMRSVRLEETAFRNWETGGHSQIMRGKALVAFIGRNR